MKNFNKEDGPRRFPLGDPWVWRMAWRDARHHYSRLLLFMTSLIAGIAAVVSLDAVNQSLQFEIDRNAKELLGADLVVRANSKFEDTLAVIMDSISVPQASEVSMASMVSFLSSGRSRLIQLVAYEGPFPFYGNIVTAPASAYSQLKDKGFALLDQALSDQYGVRVGDSLRLGNQVFAVAGMVSELPGGGGIRASFTPSVYISGKDLERTGLVQYGSRVNYKRYFFIPQSEEVVKVKEHLEPLVKRYGYDSDTVADQKENLGEAFLSIYRFFSLLAFVALILGCIGVASSVYIYAQEKREEVALLRCIGSSGWQAFSIYFVQIFTLGLLGSVVGVALGLGVQQVLSVMLQGFVPFEITNLISWRSLILGLALGTWVALLFSALPLLSIRQISPLVLLRSALETKKGFSKTRMAILLIIGLFPFGFAAFQTGSLLSGWWFFFGLIAALALLMVMAMGLLALVRKFFPHQAPFVWRHALSNLFRPNNQTRVLMVTIGLGTFIISTLNIVQESMLQQVEFQGSENQSNTILFDIQPYQREGVLQLMEKNHLPVHQSVPIVTCRLKELKGKSIAAIQADTTDGASNWALTREYRVTYRDTLHVSEKLIEGELPHQNSDSEHIHVTVSEGMLSNLDIKLGDSLVFDVQGVPIAAIIGGVRKVSWPRDPPNFIFVFPEGVLEQAPQVFVATTYINKQHKANTFQEELLARFPNVSVIDLRLILNTLDDIFGKLSLVVQFLALFSVITGLVVLAGAVINSKYVRIKEYVLLRTLGAMKKQIISITLIEYAYLGFFSAVTGILLSVGSGWLLAKFFFNITFAFKGVEMGLLLGGVMVLTMLIGWWNCREVIKMPPLQVLRRES